METKIVYGNYCMIIKTEDKTVVAVEVYRMSEEHGDVNLEPILDQAYVLEVLPEDYTISKHAKHQLNGLQSAYRKKGAIHES